MILKVVFQDRIERMEPKFEYVLYLVLGLIYNNPVFAVSVEYVEIRIT